MEKYARKCDITEEGMNEGYCIMEGEMYIKSHMKMLEWITNETDYDSIEDAYDDDYYYYTEWCEEDADYVLIDNNLVEI